MFHRQYLLPLLVLTSLAPAACTTNQPITDTYTGTVTKVHDGDSIHITPKGEKRVIIRLAGIDAPELKQSFGIASCDTLRTMILNRQAEAKCHKTDRYQRQVCVVYFNGEDVNLQMVRAGMAWHYKAYQKEQGERQRRQYSKAESRARSDRQGCGMVGVLRTLSSFSAGLNQLERTLLLFSVECLVVP